MALHTDVIGRRVLMGSLLPAALLLSLGPFSGPSRKAASSPEVQVQHREAPDDPPLGRPAPPKFFSRGGGASYGQFNSVQVNVDKFGNNIPGDAANEPSIGISPANPDVIVIGWRQFDNVASNFRQAGWGYSHNAGASWTFPGVLDPGVFRSDPVLDSDTDGNIYYYSLFHTGSDWHCDMYISGDGGVSWLGPNFGFGGDKAWFTVDKTGSVGHGNIYSAWSTAGNVYYPNQFSRSTDGGFNWMDPIEIPPRRHVWGTLTVDPQGDLYVSGQRSGVIYVSKSTDAKFGAVTPSFDFTVEVPLGGSFVSRAGPNPGGLLAQVWVAADNSKGPMSGNVYLLSSINPPGGDPLDVFFARSEDGGLTWSAPVRVNDDPTGTNAWQWFGTMSVAPNGRIDAIWNDTRNSGQDNISELFYSYSLDGGRTWSRNVVMSPPWNSHIGWPNQNKIGDYYDMVSDNTGAGLAYSATFNGEQDVYYLRIEPFAMLLPESFNIIFGSLSSGGLSDMFESDDLYLEVTERPAVAVTLPSIRVELLTTYVGSVSELTFKIELSCTAAPPIVVQHLELYNYDTSSWDLVHIGIATTTDSVITHTPATPSDYIDAGTGEMKSRISLFDPGTLFSPGWKLKIDQAIWSLLE